MSEVTNQVEVSQCPEEFGFTDKLILYLFVGESNTVRFAEEHIGTRYDFIQIIPCRRKGADGGYIGIKRTYVDIVALFVGGFIYPSIVRTNFRQHP